MSKMGDPFPRVDGSLHCGSVLVEEVGQRFETPLYLSSMASAYVTGVVIPVDRALGRDALRLRVLELLAALSHRTQLSVGCYCEDERRCHRSILKKLLEEYGADLV